MEQVQLFGVKLCDVVARHDDIRGGEYVARMRIARAEELRARDWRIALDTDAERDLEAYVRGGRWPWWLDDTEA